MDGDYKYTTVNAWITRELKSPVITILLVDCD